MSDLDKLKRELEKKKKKLETIENIGNTKANLELITGKKKVLKTEKEVFKTEKEVFKTEKEVLQTEKEVYCRIGNKGTICVYGLRDKLPVSLRPEQWEMLYQFMFSGKLHDFIHENKDKL